MATVPTGKYWWETPLYTIVVALTIVTGVALIVFSDDIKQADDKAAKEWYTSPK